MGIAARQGSRVDVGAVARDHYPRFHDEFADVRLVDRAERDAHIVAGGEIREKIERRDAALLRQ